MLNLNKSKKDFIVNYMYFYINININGYKIIIMFFFVVIYTIHKKSVLKFTKKVLYIYKIIKEIKIFDFDFIPEREIQL